MPTPSFMVCPKCGEKIQVYRNPAPTADAIIEIEGRIILIERKFPPDGWAIPGGFVEYGETLEQAAIREAREETCLDIELKGLLGVYSEPNRDPRQHTITTVFVATASGEPRAADDAKSIGLFAENDLPRPMAFDHDRILREYYLWKKNHSR